MLRAIERLVIKFEHGYVVPETIVEDIRSEIEGDERTKGEWITTEVRDIRTGVWFVRGAVDPHRDRLEQGWLSCGLTIIDEMNSTLMQGGRHVRIPAGTVWQFDPSLIHELRVEKPGGLFVFLVWDVPADIAQPLRTFAMEAVADLAK